MFLLILILIIGILYLCKDVIKQMISARKWSHIPGPRPVPLYGNTGELAIAKRNNAFMEVFLHWRTLYGDTFKFYIKTRPVIFSVDPDVLKQITQDVINFVKVDHLPNRSLFGQRITGTYSILTGGGQEWGIKRKVMTSFFAKQNMANLFPKLMPLMTRLLESKIKPQVGSGAVLDIHELYSTIFSALPGIYGMECPMGVETPEEVGRRINIFLDIIPMQLGNLTGIWGARVSEERTKITNMVIEMRGMGLKMITEKRQEMKNLDSTPDNDMLAWLIKANDAAGLSDDEVVDDIMTVYLVMDNMTKQLGALFIYLIDHKEIMDKMTSELRENPITDAKSLDKLKYTEMVILESLRLTPVLQRGTRWLNKGMQVGKYLIPEECQFQYSQYVLHRIEEYWPNPRQFIPERFEKGCPHSADSFKFLPFLAGSRACLGKHVAMIAMKATLSMLLTNFDLTPVPTGIIPTVVTSMAVTRLKGGPYYLFDPLYSSTPIDMNEVAEDVYKLKKTASELDKEQMYDGYYSCYMGGF